MRRSFHLGKISTSLLILSLSAASNAEITWNGFLSTGGGFADPNEENGTLLGYEEDFTFNNETVLGLQLRSDISDKLSATGQLVARGIEEYNVNVAWAYIAYEASESTTFRLGRFRTPYYLYSDFLEVGYAYHWISPPEDVYSDSEDSIDGFDVVYTTPLGVTEFTAQFYGGSVDSDSDAGDSGFSTQTSIRNQFGLALSLNYDWLTLRGSHHVASSVTVDGLPVDDLVTALDQLGTLTGQAGYSQAAADIPIQDVEFAYDELAVKVDWNNFLFVAEATKLVADSGPVESRNRMFATVGYTFGPVMVHLTHSKSSDDSANISSTIPLNIPGTEATSVVLANAVDTYEAGFKTEDKTTNIIGARWDVESGLALKVEYAMISEDDELDGSDIGGNILRFAIDAVF